MIDWNSPTWGNNPVHESATGSWLESEPGGDDR